MQNKGKHIQMILNYLLGKMTDKDRYAFERSMEADPFLRDAVEGYEKLSEEEINGALKSLHHQLSTSKPKQLSLWIRVAAIGILVLGIGALLIIGNNGKKDGLVADQIELETDHKDLSVNQRSSPIKEIEPSVEVIENEEKSLEKSEGNSERNREVRSKVPVAVPELKKAMVVADDVDLPEEMEGYEDAEMDELSLMMSNKIQGVEVDSVLKTEELDRQQDVLTGDLFTTHEMTVYKGTVVDEEGFPLPGVTVVNQGTLKGAITDMEGNFEINVPKQKKSSLAFNSIGFKSKKVMPEGDSLGEIVLKSDQLVLDEVVAVGYGTAKKRGVTSSSAKTELNEKSVSNPDHLTPEPVIGMRKFTKRIEKNLKDPFVDKHKSIKVEVNIFISVYGEVKDIQILTNVDNDFAVELKKRIVAASKWIPPYVNGMPIESSRIVVFSFE